ncbi:lycopene cyclase family protein [Flavobacteriaceae bacterium]|jgi:lycopene beta-cyclase|nr:lycopene cyclase family protein [Flavobacteriaceae bacterium]MDC1167710.1 lycopene cyclase family protein [Flavobacteriaceae bacterium]MDC3227446.1 lycopene cyclase family protein [bacterium]MDC3285598.1 lycopene cyclase family protein [Flavobacteriaceae bacterium]MDC3318377.1 lycopene cyclase family protein [Flavobacteriaceae bacterium]
MQNYDYIITGSGASGLMLAYRMAKDSFFDNASILIIDKEKKTSNDRTWCFWENGEGEWDELLHKSWDKILFESNIYKNTIPLQSYAYKMLRSGVFYDKLWNFIETKNNISFIKANVTSILDTAEGAFVETSIGQYRAVKLLNSIDFDQKYTHQEEYPVLLQHFTGWFVETKKNYFDDSVATFMDFTVDQKRNTRFMYVLPISPNKALFEYTLFSKEVLTKDEYEGELLKYLATKSITEYTITEIEQGVIPMTSYKFWEQNSKNILHIGTVGGWTKASTGYTFKNTSKKTIQLIAFLKAENDFTHFRKKTRFWWYDLLLIDVLSFHNHLGSKLFSTLFKRNSLKNVFRFLDEETSFIEDLRIMLSMPPLRFIIALFKRVLNY